MAPAAVALALLLPAHEGRLGSTGGYPSNWYFVPAACVNLPS